MALFFCRKHVCCKHQLMGIAAASQCLAGLVKVGGPAACKGDGACCSRRLQEHIPPQALQLSTGCVTLCGQLAYAVTALWMGG
jgi:hypothetical protein